MKCKTPRNYLKGGKVRGPGTATSDSILARLSNGEYVLPKVAVDQVGVQNLEAIRQAALAKAPRMRLGGRISTLADKAVQAAIARPHAVKNTVVGSLLENTLGIGPGLGGLAAGMTRSAPAQAAVLDNTQTQEYQQAQDAIRQGRGNKPTGGIFGLKGILAGPTPAETVRELEQQQAVQDEQYRQLVGGGPTPTEQRMLQDMNRASVKGYALGGPISGGLNFQSEQEPTSTTFYPSGLPTASAPSFGDAVGGTNTGIKLGGSPAATPPGSLNAFGSDLSLTNRMNAGAEALSKMREGPAAPTANPADDFVASLSKALQGNDPAKQAAEARKAVQAKADPLDVASGRFDREYAPGMAQGGLISQGQWERLPRFAEGWDGGYQNMVDPETRRRLQAESMQRIDSGFKDLTSEQAPVYSPRYGAGATPAPTTPRVPATAQPPAQSAPPAPGATTLPPAPSAQAGAVPPPAFTPAVGFGKGTNFDVPAKPSTPATPKLPPAKETAQIYAEKTGGALLNNAPGPGIGPQAVVAAPSRPIGTQSYTTGQPFEPSQGTAPPPPLMGSQRIMSGNGVTGPVTTGGSNVPIYQTDYTVFGPKGQQGTLSVTGPDQRVGGGTVSQPDQGNGGTVEGNVAALERQYQAVKSRNDAYGYGGGTVGSALPAAPASVDIWARPGDSFGDSQMRQGRYEGLLQDAARQQGFGSKQKATALIEAAQTLAAPGLAAAKLNAEQVQGNQALAMKAAEQQASALANAQKTAQDQAKALRDQSNTDRDFNLKTTQAEIDAYAKSRNIGFEQAKYELEAYKAMNPPQSNSRFPDLTGGFYGDPLKPGQPRSFDYKGVANRYGIQPASPDGKGMIPGEPRYLENGDVITVDAQGALIPFSGGWEGAAYQKWKEMQKR